MVADAGDGPSPQDLPKDGPNRRQPSNTSLWAGLAIVLVVAIIVLMLLTQCTPKVPNVVGLGTSQARTRLERAGYEVGELSYVNDTKRPAGTVVEQAPVAGTILARGNGVDLILAKGELVEVPDVRGHDSASAESELKANSLRISISSDYNATVPFGAIFSQAPNPGTKVPAGSYVAVLVSRGPTAISSETSGASGATGPEAVGSIGGGSATTDKDPCTAAYPGSPVWSSGGSIYIRLSGSGPAKRLTSGHWDTDPVLAPSGKYVVFLRAQSSGARSTSVGKVCLTNFKTTILTMPTSGLFGVAPWYSGIRFAPAKDGTSPDSDLAVIAQYYLTNPDEQNPNARLIAVHVPQNTTYVAWDVRLRHIARVSLSGSSSPGFVKASVTYPPGGVTGFYILFNAWTGELRHSND